MLSLARRPQRVPIPAGRDRPPCCGKALICSPGEPGQSRFEVCEMSGLDPAVYDLFDRYVHSQITHREFLDSVSKYAVGGLTATAILNYLSPSNAEAAQIEPCDERLRSEYITYDSPKGRTMKPPSGNTVRLSRYITTPECGMAFITIQRRVLTRMRQSLPGDGRSSFSRMY